MVSVSDAKSTNATSRCPSSGLCAHCARNSGSAPHAPIGTVALATLLTTSAMARRTAGTGSRTTPSSSAFLNSSWLGAESVDQCARTLRLRTTAASCRTLASASPRAWRRSAAMQRPRASRTSALSVASATPRDSFSADSNARRISGRCSSAAPDAGAAAAGALSLARGGMRP